MARESLRKRLERVLDDLQGRQLEEYYLLSPEFRRSLQPDPKYSDKRLDKLILTRAMLNRLEASSRQWLKAKEFSFAMGTGLSAESALALPPASMMSDFKDNGTVVIVPGGMASSLADVSQTNPGLIWINLAALKEGRFDDLELAPYDGHCPEKNAQPEVEIEAVGPIPGLYALLKTDLLLSNFATVVFPYDWRVDIECVAQDLKDLLWCLGQQAPVHVVTHSLGALVARRAIQLLKDDKGEEQTREILKHLVMLGPSNYGTFLGALALAAALDQVPFIKLFKIPGATVQPILKTFTAYYQLLPWDEGLLPSLSDPSCDVRRREFWGDVISGEDARFQRAFPDGGTPWAQGIDTSFFKDRTTVIVGFHRRCPTAGGVMFKNGAMKVADQYVACGDGWVPHVCSVLKEGTATYMARGVEHLRLPLAPRVIDAVIRVLHDQSPVPLVKPYVPIDPRYCRKLGRKRRRKKVPR